MRQRQYAAVRFRPGDKRTYTYHWDEAPLVPGDIVKVPDRSGDGWTRATVEAVHWEKPAFATKAIIGLLAEGEVSPAPAPPPPPPPSAQANLFGDQ